MYPLVHLHLSYYSRSHSSCHSHPHLSAHFQYLLMIRMGLTRESLRYIRLHLQVLGHKPRRYAQPGKKQRIRQCNIYGYGYLHNIYYICTLCVHVLCRYIVRSKKNRPYKDSICTMGLAEVRKSEFFVADSS